MSRQRPHLVGVRLSPAEMALLEAEAGRLGLTSASVLRQAFLATVPCSREEHDLCPMGCGRTTEDPYGGPCAACWTTADLAVRVGRLRREAARRVRDHG